MDPIIGAGLIEAGGGLLGGVLNYFGNKKGQEQADRHFAESNRLQKEFAQNSIQWRAADAKKAGLSPMAALGAYSSSYTPSASFSTNEMSSIAGGIADSASAIGRSMQMLALQKQRSEVQAIDSQTQKNEAEADLAKAKAENVTKTNRGYNKFVTMPGKSDTYLGHTSKPLYELNPINKNRFTINFAEGTVDAERASEGSFFQQQLMYNRLLGVARQAAKDASQQYGGSWYAHQNVDGSWEVIRRGTGYHSPLEFVGDYYERLWN